MNTPDENLANYHRLINRRETIALAVVSFFGGLAIIFAVRAVVNAFMP